MSSNLPYWKQFKYYSDDMKISNILYRCSECNYVSQKVLAVCPKCKVHLHWVKQIER